VSKILSNSGIVYGEFKEEIKNRFLCIVNINGSDTVCYIPSSCRLSNFIDLANRRVILRPIKNKNARTKYAVYAIKYGQGYVPLNLSDTNRLIEKSLKRRIFSFLGARKNIYREENIDGYKSDLYITDTDTIIEIKSVLSFSKNALFPTVFSGRANRQLKSIMSLLENGHKVCYMLILMYSGTKSISINEQQTEYAELFNACVKKGMAVFAFSLGMSKGEVFVKSRIKTENSH
jgi:DNA-binding sugar fermentation-stimulating protein